MTGVKIICACCGVRFAVCKSCYCGQVYCSDQCRESGYREKSRLRQRKFRKTEKGKQRHAEDERKRRRKKKNQN